MAGEEQISPELQRFIMMEQEKAQLQQTVAKLTETCWDKCMGSPGNSLSYRESACFENCAKRFLETTQFIIQRFQQKASEHGSSGF
mmetsp:Transcript_5253/g.15051  ORF Transcript_5253/g.15051 Transcript_5253/m.15051 type:complete len:86 (+) Transcript_5253:234-491(+)|eukprot:CAMPEP_0206135612 /NCGR_PEP_ID=MMETSP1473-20131121/883_1 /ASSEMBLY_ACC=CAM_ASM_001109 /TAXON_ID=1461547 /ORGANISM="Stichococcus sp, Strain RCC1054" /LENGTH=85 /DNA_ID=CAMNT_0053527583 /DNA_START=188 /DNA_END=445 /DNA_ORIENTATION=-